MEPEWELESEMGKTRTRNRIGIGVWRFLSDSERSWSLVSNYKIETNNDARVKCDFDVTRVKCDFGFPNFENFGVGLE